MINQTTNLFSQLANQYLTGSTDQDIITDPDIQKVVHGLQKKSETTKSKTLQELKILLPKKDSEFFEQFTPTFINIYRRYVDNEYERKVLELANQVLGLIAEHGKKSLIKKFKQLFPQWFIMMNDYNTELSSSAQQSFNIAFQTQDKQTQALKTCQDNLLQDLKYYFQLSQNTIKQESNLEDEKVEHIYERLKVAAISSIKMALQWNTDPNFLDSIMQLLDFNSKTTIIVELLNSQKTRIVSSILETLSFLLNNERSASSVLLKSEQLTKRTIQLFEIKDRLVITSLWSGFVVQLFQKVNPEIIQKQTQLESKQLEMISKAGYGVGKPLYDQLVRFVACNPIYQTNQLTKEEHFKQKLASITKLLQTILLGISHEESRFFSENLINSYFEILYFVICKRMIPPLQQFPNTIGQVKNIIINSLKNILQSALNQQGVLAYNHNPYKQVPLSLLQFFNILKVNDNQIDTLKYIIDQIIIEMKQLVLTDYNVFVNIVIQLLKIDKQCLAYQSINNYLQQIYKEVYDQNDLERGSQLFPIIPNIQLFYNINTPQTTQNLIQNLFNSIDLLSQEELLKQCNQVKIIIYNLERIYQQEFLENQLKKIIDQEYKQQIPKEEQQHFKRMWICLHSLCDPNPDYYQKYITLQDSQSEYNLIEKSILNKKQSQILQYLILKSLSITNLSQKIFIPCIVINFNEQIQELLQIRYQQIAQQVQKDNAYLQIFEEFSFILHKLKNYNKIIFDVLLSFYVKGQSHKVQFILNLINQEYESIFVQFFIQEQQKNDEKFINLIRDILTKINLTILLPQIKFNLQNPQPWKIFQLIDISDDYFKTQYKNNLELIAMFLAANYSSIMLYDHKLKRFIQNLVSNKIKPLILDSYEKEEESSLEIIKILFSKKDIVYGVALRHLIKTIILEEKENNYRFKQTEKLSDLIIEQYQLALEDKNQEDRLITIRQIINIIDINKLFGGFSAQLELYKTKKTFPYLDLLNMTLLNHQEDFLDLEDDEKLDNIITILYEQPPQTNYEYMVAFEFINLICERRTITPLASKIKQLAEMFKGVFQHNLQLKRYYSFAIVTALQFVRKILNFIEAFPIEFLDYLNFEITDSLLQIIQFCSQPKVEFMDEQNDTLFIEYAETLLRCIQMEQWADCDISTYHQLLQCPFISIQKAAFLILKNKENNLELGTILSGLNFQSEEMKRMKLEDEDFEDIITFPLDGKILTYLLAWLVVLQNKNCITFKDKFGQYLSNLLYILHFLQESGVNANFNYKEIYSQELDLMIIQDDPSELLKLVIISFYQFILIQQSYFKSYYNQECTNQQKKQLDSLLVMISKAIYVREVELIELKQEEWRSDGFDIFVSKNQQEITATYQKEEQKIEILIQVPVGFPLKSLKVETKKGVKISEDKLKKWSLMIRMILQNENDTILTALKLWKKNIDQQFQDLEECAICYYIIHQTGELPKMACKTCKHKFHSNCIQKWFHSSNKSDCPLCKSQFL